MDILTAVFVVIALVFVMSILIRVIGNNKKWNEYELRLIEDIEKSAGQKIVIKTRQNISRSTDFRTGKECWLWLAFTADVPFVIRVEIAGNGGNTFLFQTERILRLRD